MLFVQTNNNNEQQVLQADFSREDNLFAVSFVKASQINLLLKNLTYEVYGQKSTQKDNRQLQMPELAIKFIQFAQNVTNLKFSLTTAREIFELIKIQSQKTALLEEYYKNIGCQLQIQESSDPLIDSIRIKNQISHSLGVLRQFQTDVDQQINQIQCDFECSIRDYHLQTEPDQELIIDTSTNKKLHHLHSLDNQFIHVPKFNLLKSPNLREAHEIDQSYFQENEIINVDEQKAYTFTPKAKFSIKKQLSTLLSTEGSEKKYEAIDFIQSLSGRVHPLPSFLHDEDSMTAMIAKQKSEDVLKSNIIKKSLKNNDEKQMYQGKMQYNKSLRYIKLKNKLKRNSRNSFMLKNQMHKTEGSLNQPEYGVKKEILSTKQQKIKTNPIKQKRAALLFASNQFKDINKKILRHVKQRKQ